MTIVLDSPPSQAVKIGPTEAPPPSRTLGNEVLDWCETHLLQPDGPDAGKPWRFTPEQIHFVLCWYEIDERGRFVYRRGTLRRMKGWGKNPLQAALCLVEFVGPCRFDGFQGGIPLVIPNHAPWVQTVAVAKDQTRNTWTLFPAMLPRRLLQAEEIELGKELAYGWGGRARMEAVTSSPRALEGARATYISKDETHHWLATNEGHEMDKVIARNAAKSREGASRAVSFTNAHNPGEDSIGEREYDAYLKMASGKSRGTGVLYDSLEAAPDTDMKDDESLLNGIIQARGDSTWLDAERLMGEIRDPTTPPSTARRFYLNQIVAAEDAWVDPKEWDRLARPQVVDAKIEITLGFDGSKSDDHSALIACRVSDGYLWPLGIWDPLDYPDGEIPRVEIDRAVHMAFADFLVDVFYSDVHPFESYVDEWEAKYGEDLYVRASTAHAIGFDLRGHQKEATQAAEAFHDAIMTAALTHSGDPRFSQHVYNARRRPNAYGVTFGKEHPESSRKVDAVSAAVLARKARQDYLTLPERKRRRAKSGRAMFV